jgi:hypothetical protein
MTGLRGGPNDRREAAPGGAGAWDDRTDEARPGLPSSLGGSIGEPLIGDPPDDLLDMDDPTVEVWSEDLHDPAGFDDQIAERAPWRSAGILFPLVVGSGLLLLVDGPMVRVAGCLLGAVAPLAVLTAQRLVDRAYPTHVRREPAHMLIALLAGVGTAIGAVHLWLLATRIAS